MDFFMAKLLAVVLLFLGSATGSHFRGGIFMVRPRPGGGANEMEIFYHISWRRSSGAGGNCNANTVSSGTYISGQGILTCISGCSFNIGSLSYQCTDYDATEDWSFGQNIHYQTFPASTTVSIGFTGSGWIAPINSYWNLQSTFSTVVRSDIGVINSTPRAATSPVIRLQSDCSHQFQLAVSDPDGDVVKCRWGVGMECYDVCGGFPGATIDSDTCTISYTANQGTGYKAAAVAIEDFQTASSSTPFSTVVLQFLVYVFTNTEPCSSSPYFVSPPTLKSGVCVAVDSGDTFTTQIMANSNSSSASISSISTISPSGSTKTNVVSVGSGNLYYINITWTPTAAQQGQTYVLCYTATSSTGTNTEQYCIKIDAGVLPPQPNTNTLSPADNNTISESGQTWSLNFTKDIQKPSVSSSIKFHSATNDAVVHSIDTSSSSEVTIANSTLTFAPTYAFSEEQSFYITFEGGIVNSLDGCQPGNVAVTSKTFWTFRSPKSSDPVITSSIYTASEFDYYYGSSVDLICHSAGKPVPAVNWYRNGVLLSPGSNGVSISKTTNGQNVTSQLTISSVMTSHEGKYTCNGTNTLTNGTVTTDIESFDITIQGILAVNMTGVAVSSTAIYLTWDVPLVPSIVVKYFVVECDELETEREWSFFAVETHANIISLHPHYSYSCRVQIIGNETYRFNTPIIVITHQAAPTGSPQNPSSVADSSSSLNLTWYPPPVDKQNGIIIYYIIKLTELETGSTLQFTSNTTYLYLTSLHPYYSYTFYLAAVTIVDEGPFSSNFTVLMPEDAPTAAPLSVSAVVSSSTSVSISWAPPPFEHQNGIIRKYEIYLVDQNGLLLVTSVQSTSVTIANLHPNYVYNMTIAAITIFKGVESESIIFTTPEDAPSKSPTMFNATSTSPYSAYLTWEPPPEDGQNGVIIEYVIRVDIIETNQTVYLYSNYTYLVVNTLRPYRTYVCIIAARTAVGIGPYGPQFTLTSPQDAPSGPPSLTYTSQSLIVTSTSFFLKWDPPSFEDVNGVVQYYRIRVTEVETGKILEYTSYSIGITISSLHPAYTYRFTIAAYTVGLGPYSEPFNVTLDEEAPSGSPQVFTGTSYSSSSITLSWNPPPFDQQNGVIISYYISITSLGNGVTTNYTTNGTQFTLSGLAPFSTYSCIIAAQTSIGTGPFTLSITILTLEDAPNVAPVINVGYSIDPSTVAIQWTAPPPEDHNGIIREYRVLITNLNTGENQTRVFTSTTGIIGSLTPSFEYRFSVTAFTVAEGPYSSSITITMPQDVPSGYPQSISGNSTSPTGIYISWSPPLDNEQNGDIVQYIVNVTHADTLATVQYFTTKTYIYITGLDPYTTYVCVVAAETAVGVGPFSNLYFIQTEEDAPDSAPLHASGISLGSTSIHITWDPPLVDDHNGVIREYRVNVTQLATQFFDQLVTNQTQIIIEDLKPYHIYHCYISAITVDEGPYTTAITVLTDEAAPSSPPVSVSVSVVDSTSITMTWSPPPTSDHNGIIRSYSIIVTANGGIHDDEFTFTTQGTTFSTSVLNPYTTYTVQVAAFTVDTGPYTTGYNITTHQDVPSSPPQKFNATAQSATDVYLAWLPPVATDINGVIQHYNVSYTEIQTGTLTTNTITATSTTISSLHPFYTYKFTVSAVTIGNGPGISVIVQMPESAPATAPSGVVASNITSTSVHLSWDPIPDYNQNGIIRHYKVNLTETNTGTQLNMIAYSNELTVSDLHPHYTYQVIIAAHTIDTGPYSAIVSYQLNEDVPTSSPTNLITIVHNSTHVEISWNPPPLSEQNGVITEYTVSVTNVETAEPLTPVVTSLTSITVGNLIPYTVYYCVVSASTSVGSGPDTSFEYFETDEAAPLSPPENVTIVYVSSSEILLTWVDPPLHHINGIIRRYDVQQLEQETQITTVVSSTNTQITLTSLHAYYNYHISVAAVTVASGPYSSTVSAITHEAAPSAAPLSISVSPVSSTSLNISWSLPPANQTNGIIRHYNIRVQESETALTFNHESLTTSLLLSNLHPYYTYTVFVAAVTVASGPYTAGITTQTPADVPSGPPQNVTGSVISSTKLEVSWDPPVPELQNGPIKSYTITVYELDTNTTTQEHKDFLHNTIVLVNLHPNYDYSISVAAYTVGLGPSTDIQLTTLEDIPSAPPKHIQVTDTTSTTVTLQWTEPNLEDQNGVIKHYRIIVVGPDNSQQVHTSSSLSIQLTNLHPHYLYQCTIQAVTIGNGPSANINFTTLEDVPASAPTNLSTSLITSTGVLLSWNPLPPVDHNGIILGYTVTLTEGDTNNQWNLTSNTTSLHVLAILSPHTAYQFTVAAHTVIGLGPASIHNSFTTKEDSPVSSPRQVTASMITSTSFLLSWIPPVEEDINGVVTGYRVVVTVQETQEQFTVNTTATNATLTQLHPFYVHHCTVTCITVAEGPYSNSIGVRTLQDAPSSTVTSFSVVAPFPHTLTITWQPPPTEDTNGIILFYSVHITVAETQEVTEYKPDKSPFFINTAHPYYTYSVKVAAVTVAYGPYTPVTTVVTPEAAPTGPALNVTSDVLNSTAIYLSWLPPEPSKRNGVIRKYIISVSESVSDAFIDTFSVPSTNTTINGLHPYYGYEVSVVAFTVAAGPIIEVSFTMDEDVPSTGPLNVSVSNITSTSVFIDWAPPLPHHHNGVIRHYAVTLKEVPANTVAVFNTTDLFLHLQDLHPYYDYTFDISVVTIGPGPGYHGTFKLLEDVPNTPPHNVTVWPVNATTLAVSWDDIEEHDKNGRIRFYRLAISDLKDSSFRVEIQVYNSTIAVITNLKPFHTYTVEIAGHTIVTGPYSDTINTTLPQAAPSEPPAELVAILEQNLTIHISWVSPSEDAINGVLLGYHINCTALNEHQLTADVSGTGVSIHRLQPSTHYTCSVCAYTVIGCGPSGLVYISTYEGSLVGPPSSLAVSTVSATRVTIHWAPPFDPDDIIIAYGITYQLISTSFPIETPRLPVTIISHSNNTFFTVESLLTNTNYRMVVFAIYDGGTGPISEPISMTTLAEDEFSVRNYRCQPESSDSMKCSWDHPVPVEEYYLSDYQLSYRLADGWDYYPGYGTELGRVSLSPVTTEYTITGLRPYGGYIIELTSVMSHDLGSGDYAMSDDVIDEISSVSSVFNTTELEIPTAAVENFKVTITSASSADISFRPPSRVTWNGAIESYGIVAVRGSANTGEDTADSRKRRETEVTMVTPQANHPDPSLAMEPLQKENYRLNNLEENFEYQFSVIIINSKGAGVSNTPMTQTMPESVPSSGAIDIAAVNVTKSAMTVTWRPPNPLEANGVVLMYSLNLTRVSIRDTLIKQFPKDQLSYRQQGLQIYETISVSVAAMTSVGWGPYSNVTYFNTLEDFPGSPADLKEELVNGSTVILTWGTPSNPNGVVTDYQIRYSGHERSQSSVSDGPFERSIAATSDDSRNTIAITNLIQGYFYEFKVRGKNGAGYGENSTVVVLIPQVDGADAGRSEGALGIGTSIIGIIAGSVAFVIIIIVLLVLGVICIVKRNSGKSQSVQFAGEPQETFTLERRNTRTQSTVNMELPVIKDNTLEARSYTNTTEDNEYKHMTFTPNEVLPDLKKQSSFASPAYDRNESDSDNESRPYEYGDQYQGGATAGGDDDHQVRGLKLATDEEEKKELSFL